MTAAINRYCLRSGQPAPANSAAYTRAILGNLAFKYRYVLEALEDLMGTCFEEIRIMG